MQQKIHKYTGVFLKTAQYVERKLTRLTGADLAKALHDGFQLAFGRPPTLQELASGYAQAMQEQGGNFYNYNFGNITANKTYRDQGGMHTLFTNISEYTETGDKRDITKNYFRAYPSAEQGAADFWKLLGSRFTKSFGYMQAGQPINAALALSDEYYYTGNRFIYSANMGYLYKQFMEEIAPKMTHKYPELANVQNAPKAPPTGPAPEYKAYRKTEVIKDPGQMPEKFRNILTYYKQTPNNQLPMNESIENQVENLERMLWG